MNTRVFENEARTAPRSVQSSTESAHAVEAHAQSGDGNERSIYRDMPASAAPLFPAEVCRELESRWTQVQTGFVDTPRQSVQHADELVADAIRRLSDSFSQERAKLEAQWSRDGDVSTEDLRVALQRYRSFFQRLLHI